MEVGIRCVNYTRADAPSRAFARPNLVVRVPDFVLRLPYIRPTLIWLTLYTASRGCVQSFRGVTRYVLLEGINPAIGVGTF